MIEWLIALGIGLTIFVIIYSLSFAIMVGIIKKAKSVSSIIHMNQWMTSLIVSPIVLLLSLLAILFFSSGSLQMWGFEIPSIMMVLSLGSFGLISAFIILYASERLSPTPQKMRPPSDRNGRLLFLLIIVILTSVSEEVLFRGFLQNILDTSLLYAVNIGWLSVTAGAVVSAIFFGLVHIAPAKQMGSSVPVLVVSATILGLLAGIFLTVSGSLIPSILLHMEFNLVGFLFGIISKSD